MKKAALTKQRSNSIMKRRPCMVAWEEFYKKLYERLQASGVRAERARLTIARKLAAVALAIWKSGEEYDEMKMSKLAA